MMKRFLIVGILAGLAACSDQPAGGVSYFDQNNLPQPNYANPGAGLPMTASQQQLAFEQSERARIAALNGDPLVGTIESALNEADGGNGFINQANATSINPATGLPYTGIGIDRNADSINLAQYSQEQQKIDRENAARELALARSQLVVVSPDQIQGGSRSNALQQYARATTHGVGEKKYRRGLFSDAEATLANCNNYRSSDDAQRAFLAAGGPASDSQNLDPDGDGFACRWSPTPYRN
jgi:hypothetical protein